MRTVPAATALAAALAFAAPAVAQPVPELPDWVTEEAATLIWCSALFMEEGFRQAFVEDAMALGRWYDGLSYLVQEAAAGSLGPERTEDDLQEIWTMMAAAATELAAEDGPGYGAALDACEAEHEHRLPRSGDRAAQ